MNTCSKATEHLGIELTAFRQGTPNPSRILLNFLHLHGIARESEHRGGLRNHHLGNLCITGLWVLQQGQLCSECLNTAVLMHCCKFLCLELQESPCYHAHKLNPKHRQSHKNDGFSTNSKRSGLCELVPNLICSSMKPALHTWAAPRPCRSSPRATWVSLWWGDESTGGFEPACTSILPSLWKGAEARDIDETSVCFCSSVCLGHIFCLRELVLLT